MSRAGRVIGRVSEPPDAAQARPPRRWSLRALLLLVVILAAGLAVVRRDWQDERTGMYRDRARKAAQIEALCRAAERLDLAAGRTESARQKRLAGDRAAALRRENWRLWFLSLIGW